MVRVNVKPQLLRWARERADLSAETLVHRFPKYIEWENGDTRPTVKQLRAFAKVTYAPLGYLFLREPPNEQFPIQDFRTIGSAGVSRPSVHLREVVDQCLLRQDWFHDYAVAEDLEPVRLVGSANLGDHIEESANNTRTTLKMSLDGREQMGTWSDALRQFIKNLEAEGVLVMVSSVVGNNIHRRLDPQEFRGFALADDLAPLVFVNGADSKAAQMFTLAHELAHLCLGQSALSDVGPISTPSEPVEAWCSRFAAELLVPIKSLSALYRADVPLPDEVKRLAGVLKVNTLVILRRLRDLGVVTADELRAAYAQELKRLQGHPRGSGGNSYATETSRVGERFARALATSTLGGQTLFRDALYLLDIRRTSTFRELASRLGVD